MSNCTVLEDILLGTFLVMTWGSLRFSDAQRMDLQKIIYHAETMRGVIWRSKTAVSGMPLAVAAEGFLSRGSHNWLWKFLTVLDPVLDKSGLSEVDFYSPWWMTMVQCIHYNRWIMPPRYFIFENFWVVPGANDRTHCNT